MDHGNLGVILVLTVGLGLAGVLAYITQRLKLPSIIGYLLAGFIIGPYSPGFVADMQISEQLAEVGVVLMLFGVGLHFRLEDLIRVKNIAVPGATVQTIAATVFATIIVVLSGWSLVHGIIIGLSIGVASTVVLVRVLSDNMLLNTQQGHIAVGWLVVEDIFTVIILVLLPSIAAIAGGGNLSVMELTSEVLFVLAKFMVLALFMFTWGNKIVSYLLTNVARVRSEELLTLSILALVFIISVGSTYVFGTSIALGAFIAGMVIGKTTVRHQAAANSLSLKDIFAIIFFLTVGMLFNPAAVFNHFYLFLGLIFVILCIKPLSAYLLTKMFGYSLKVALTVAVSLSQVGEFSFILAEEAMNLKILPEEAFDLLVACAIVSISINPLIFKGLNFIESHLNKYKFFSTHQLNGSMKKIEKNSSYQRVVIVGFGPIGKSVLDLFKDKEIVPTIIENNIDTVAHMEDDLSIIFGYASNTNILQDAHISEASVLLITIPDSKKALEIIHAARRENPHIEIVARARFITDKETLESEKVQYICTEGEALKAFTSLTKHVLHI